MTRYAKLGGRKPQYSKSTAEVERNNQPSNEDKSSGSHDSQRVSEQERNDEGAARPKDDEGGDDGATGPSKLLKRAKLLKLKAKKATSQEKKKAIQEQIRSLEKQAHELNGKAGGVKSFNATRKTAPLLTVDGRERTDASKGIANPWKAMEAERRAVSDSRSVHRREKRAEQRELAVRCYACRQMGHSARDCPESQANVEKGELPIEATVVCCYRCGSTQHTLAKCRKPAPKTGSDLPFAHCFLCQKRGHLASKCEKNGGRGIYPMGGHCMLCKSVEHLAKDCPLNEAQRSGGSSAASTAAIGWIDDLGGRKSNAGADEDDFHAMSRKRTHLDQQSNSNAKRPRADNHQQQRQRVISF